ncbi:DcaP family trimeric outer membrane transporter [Pendulispora albinea]|uniref:Porin n=1 Tax=Pendulispora albinea TaxID=2741071 RepID=A0ABZ2MCU6_9BACT
MTVCSVASAQDEDPPGTFKIPGLRTKLTLSGYAQLDITYDLGGRNPLVEGDDYAILSSRIPLNLGYDSRNKTNQLYMTARTSRVGISTNTETEWADIGTRIEGDFWSGNLLSGETFTNSVLFRLRHGYGTLSGKYGSLLLGQTWTTFLIQEGTAEVVDFNGPGSGAALRQPMIRYVIPLPSSFDLSLAAENAPGTDLNGITDGTAVPATRKMQSIPDFVGRLSTSGAWGGASLVAVTVNYKDSGAPGQDSYTKQGWGLGAGTGVKIFDDTLRLMVNGGRGIGRYLFAAGGVQGVTNMDTHFLLWDALGYHVNYTHVWSPEFRSNVVWSQTFFKNNGGSTAAAPYEPRIDSKTGLLIEPEPNRAIEEMYINTFWAPNRQVEFGIEYAFGQRHTFGNDAAEGQPCTVGMLCSSMVGTMHRITTTAHFNLF